MSRDFWLRQELKEGQYLSVWLSFPSAIGWWQHPILIFLAQIFKLFSRLSLKDLSSAWDWDWGCRFQNLQPPPPPLVWNFPLFLLNPSSESLLKTWDRPETFFRTKVVSCDFLSFCWSQKKVWNGIHLELKVLFIEISTYDVLMYIIIISSSSFICIKVCFIQSSMVSSN